MNREMGARLFARALRRAGLAGAIAVAAAAATAAPAAAAAWTQVTPSGEENIDEVGLLRTADGVLHAAWVQADASQPTTQDLMTRTLSATGTSLGPIDAIVTQWASLSNPALIPAAGGLRAFFGGIRTAAADEPNNDLNTAASPDGGATWTLQIGNASNGAAAYTSDVAATALPNFTPVTAWGSSFGTFTTTGTTPASLFNLQSQLGGSFGYDPGLATGADGLPYVAWASNATGREGVWGQQLRADGTPATPPHLMPDLLNNGFAQQLQRTPIAARGGGGVYVAYPGGYPASTRVVLWRIGDPTSRTLASGSGDHDATVSADTHGRLWVVWSNAQGQVFGARSDTAAHTFGATVSGGTPQAGSTIYRLDASAALDGSVDVLALSDAGHGATWHVRLLPGLTVQAGRKTVRRGHSTKVTFTVRDAGVAVAGVKVSALGHSGHTNHAGRVTLKVHPRRGRHIIVRVSATGYTATTVALTVRR